MKRQVAAQKIRRTRTKRKKKQKLIWLRRLWAGGLILALSILGLGVFVFLSSVETLWYDFHKILQNHISAFFKEKGCVLRKVTIEGVSCEKQAFLRKKLGLKHGVCLYEMNPWGLKEQLENDTLIHKALVERRFPDELYIKISERVPMARWQRRNKIVLIDHQGLVMPDDLIKNIQKEEQKDFKKTLSALPLFIGEEAPQKGVLFLKKIQNYEEITRQITALNNVSNRRWNIYLNGDLEIRLPDDGIEKAFETLVALEREGLLTVRKIQMIDLRFLPKVLVRLRDGVTLENISKKSTAPHKDSLDLDALSGHKKDT